MRPYNSHKFNLRSTQCILLGYVTNAKGYLCLDPKSNRLYTSRHVIFDENTFPFSHISSISTSSSSSHHNSWLSNLLFFEACSHNSILGPHPSTILPHTSILGPHPSTILSHPSNPCPIPIISPLAQPPFTQTAQPVPSSSLCPNTCPPLTLAQHPLPQPAQPVPHILAQHPLPQPAQPVPHITPQPESTSALPDSPIPDLQPSSSSPALPPLIPNTHPMTTRSKSGISKKKILHTTITKPKPNYLQTEPPSLTIASQIP